MISFIVIGKNEGIRLTNCMKSIENAIAANDIRDYEIIYVDSNSYDDSIIRVKIFKRTRVYKITGICNAAIARNIGAIESRGDILFFIDGDMEIEPVFLREAINAEGELIYDCVTGHLDDIFYDINGVYIDKTPRTYKNFIPANNQELNDNGGIFIINKECWDLVNGMKTKYKANEDFDLNIRLVKKRNKIIRIPFLIAKHHTIDYRNEKRMWSLIFSGYEFYPALLFKKHILCYRVILHTLRSYYTSFLLLFFIIAFFINSNIGIAFSILYICILFLKVLSNSLKVSTSKSKILYFFDHVLLQVSRDIIFWFAFLIFFPSEKKIKYTQIA